MTSVCKRVDGKVYIYVDVYVYSGVIMSTTISIRVDEGIKAEIEEMGYSPSDYIKNILTREIRKERSRKALDWLKEHMLISEGKPAEELIREDRDSR